MGGEELKWHQLAHQMLMSEQGLHTGKLVTSGISDVAIASVHSEKTRLKKLIMIIMNLSQETSIFGRR